MPETTTIAPPELQWVETRTRFRYSLSDLRLFTVTLKSHLYNWPVESVPAFADPDSQFLTATAPGSVLSIRNFPVNHHVPRLTVRNGWIRYALNQSYRYYIDIAGSFDTYLSTLSAKTRSTLKRKVKKFQDFSGASFDIRLYSTREEMPEYHRLARQVAVKTYQERLFDGALPAHEEFQNELAALAADNRVWGSILFAHDRPVSYLCLPIFDNVLEYAYLGYDPSFGSVSPGTVLLYLTLERAFAANRFRRFDFGYGNNQTKEVFCTNKHLRADLYYLRHSLKHLGVIYSHALMESCSAGCGRALDRFNLRSAIKKMLRSTGSASR